MFTMHKSERLANEAREAGAQGYVLKSQATENLVRAVHALLAGGTFFGKAAAPQRKNDKPNRGIVFFSRLAPDFA
jgi:DNA-binding NarL/FixJ family response regulator